MIAKGCPKCDQQVPVACKACPCGHSFFNARRNTRAASPAEDIRRRTQRVRREKPNYYDALEFDKQVKKVIKNRRFFCTRILFVIFCWQTKTRNSECDNDDDSRQITKKKKKVKKEDEEEDDLINHMSAEKQVQCGIILSELNRKMTSVTWKP